MNNVRKIKTLLPGILLSAAIAAGSYIAGLVVPESVLGKTLIALLLGMLISPLASRRDSFQAGVDWTAKRILRLGIILSGINLSFGQVLQAGRYALILMVFTFATAFGVGLICKRVFRINWKLASLLSVSTAICGGTAVATVGPAIRAKSRDIAYAISATFLFDLITVIAFPWVGRLLRLSDTGYGLWIGTAVNDTSSVVAAGYAFSDAAGALATIVKLTRTLFIVPVVLVFSWIYVRKEKPAEGGEPIRLKSVFPWFILGFLALVGLRTAGAFPESAVSALSSLSKWCMAAALASIGLKTSLKEVAGVGIKPMAAGVIIDTAVVIVSLIAQAGILRFLG